MPGVAKRNRGRKYDDAYMARNADIWRASYIARMPRFSKEEVDILIKDYRCPPWEWPATHFYYAKLRALENAEDDLRIYGYKRPTRDEIQAQYEKMRKERIKVEALDLDEDDPRVNEYMIKESTRRAKSYVIPLDYRVFD